MSADLRPEEFPEFFTSLYGVVPFPWQERLAERVFAKGWPPALDVPTSAGKTAAIDIAVFHLALEAIRGAERRAAVRILFVVDRRLIVDDAYGRARAISKKLSEAKEGILGRVADRLRRLAEKEENPLAVARLRGGMPKEPDWVRTPAQPTVVVSTVDQVGSRLLFRGYSVSDTMKPIHAGLLGADALLLLDEAHLSQPFVQTVRDTSIFRTKPWTENSAPAPFHVVTLSATLVPGEAGEEPFRITAEDRSDSRLAKRLGASKSTELIKVRAAEAAVAHFASKAKELVSKMGETSVVAIVVNRVKRARAIFDALKEGGFGELTDRPSQEDGASASEVALLLGRTRDLDRDKLLKILLPFVKAGPGRTARNRPLVIVATQCIEAGADLDFDALITEIAPLDCLRQRFGRLNRMGRDIDAQAAIIAAEDQIARSADPDPIYGIALQSTWNLLVERSETRGKGETAKRTIDFGIDRSASWMPDAAALAPCVAPRKDAPVLLPSAVNFWSRTWPIPAADPEVCLYLHGPETGPADIEIIWRADLDDGESDEKGELWKDRVRVCPPASSESISVPIAEARRWLNSAASADIADVESSREQQQDFNQQEYDALLWRGANNDETGLIHSNKIRPGDVIVVPAARGGCDEWGWAPQLTGAVHDVAREANWQQRGRDILRFTRVSHEAGFTAENENDRVLDMADRSDREIRDDFAPHLKGAEQPNAVRRIRVLRSRDGTPLAVELKQVRVQQKREEEQMGDAVTEDDESLRGLRQRSVTLAEHSKGVETYARCFAGQAGLPPGLAEDVTLAAYLHDAGKAHRNFKLFLYGADEVAAISGPDLAKSARLPDSPRAWDDLRTRAGLPKRARHEVASLRFAEAHARFAEAHDPDLVLWLIGTHHGYGRPFFPTPEFDWPGEGVTFETDLGDGAVGSKPALSLAELTAAWLDLSERVKQRYGLWDLARLEAILRLADHRRSEAEQEEDRSK